MHVVLANKRPVTTDKRQYDALRAAAQAHGRRLLLEATVGAGLPIIDTYQKLVESGDRVSKIEGCPSGTLGYLFGELGRGAAVSAWSTRRVRWLRSTGPTTSLSSRPCATRRTRW